MSVKFKKCAHVKKNGTTSAWKIVAKWRDIAGLLWHENECSECGTIERYRVTDLLHSLGVR